MNDRTMLQFDYEEVHDLAVTNVLGECAGLAGWWSIAIVLGVQALVIRVDRDTDELSVSLEPAPTSGGWITVPELLDAIGASLGWCWVGRNYLGYLDMFTLSLSGLEPQLCFVGEASGVNISRIARIT
ncbi:MAG: hypothetical protein EOP83_14660 [Verrucomicrobiaceae bacterium]|nr:MAG: hypothetical protein EOP83_14660 [Verrucomicrobiaceae bacterium]